MIVAHTISQKCHMIKYAVKVKYQDFLKLLRNKYFLLPDFKVLVKLHFSKKVYHQTMVQTPSFLRLGGQRGVNFDYSPEGGNLKT